MIRSVAVLVLVMAAAPVAAQPRPVAAPYWHPNPPPPPLPALATDETEIDAVIGGVYAAISGPAGPRDWAKFRAFFVPEARLVPVGPKGPLVLDIDDYIARAGAAMGREGFYEREVARRVERYGHLAHVFSTYESRRAPGEAPFARGINSFQLVRTPAGWRVLHIVWQGETPTLPIPRTYLSR